MRGSIIKRSRTSWALVVDQGRDASGKRKQKWVKFKVPRNVSQREAQKRAEAKLAALLTEIDKGSFVDPDKTTLADYMRDWHAKKVAPKRRPETCRVYLSMIEHVAKSAVGALPLQKVRATDLEAFYASLTLAASSATVCHAVIHRALKFAVRDKLIVANPASGHIERPRKSRDSGQAAREHCWSAEEARAVLVAAEAAGPQACAFFTLALHTGARKSELLGLRWSDVDLKGGALTIAQQLEPGALLEFAPTKTGKARTIPLHPDTVAALRTHRQQQRELRMANGQAYRNSDLVFAKEPGDLQTPGAALGQPCRALADRHFRQVRQAAGVKPIKFHGMRHTAATLMLAAGEPVQVVAQRLGHAQTSMTLEVYAHALPGPQQDAADRLGALLAIR